MENNPTTSRAGEELDKFKRRLIRAVARLLVQEKNPEPEVWKSLKTETGCDCQLLWYRMRALTLKKLNRLFVANDRIDAIPKVARMSLTDWLLFDLVLVHQKIDLIGQDDPTKKEDAIPLIELFELVKKYRIEELSGDNLAAAWATATLTYNNKSHQCSPMLLQRRWFQLKELTREKFYNFWYTYRGTAKRLSLAEPHTPTALQAAIAKKFKTLVTSPFLEWEELIMHRLVALPEDFEKHMMEKSAIVKPPPIKPADDTPDLELIEPNIETIDLRLESDNENDSEKSTEEESPPPTIKIKEEPQDLDIDIDEYQLESPKKSMYDVVLESTAIEYEKIDNMDVETIDDDFINAENDIEQTIESQISVQESVLPQITSVFGNVSDTSALGKVDNSYTPIIKNVEVTNVIGNETNDSSNIEDITTIVKETNENLSKLDDLNSQINNDTVIEIVATVKDDEIMELSSDPVTVIDVQENNLVDDNIQEVESGEQEFKDTSDSENLNQTMEVDVKPDISETSLTGPIKTNILEDSATADFNVDKRPEVDIEPEVNFSFGELPNDINFADDGIELVDDGIAYSEEDSEMGTKVKNEPFEDEEEIGIADTPKIDAKLLMCPIIYTTRLDDMDIFKQQPFEHVDNKQLIDCIAIKSKPIKTVPIETIETPCLSDDDECNENEITESQDHVDNNSIALKSEPIKTVPIETIETTSLSDDDEYNENEITESQKVKISSNLLQKPRSRTYNPIQLCKNPDFNTRLKRLTVGFFSSPRNRVLIKSCKPLTIDLSKTFESKLISGTLYLKPSDQTAKPEVIDDTESHHSVSVVPSAMLAQSLIDNSKIGDILPLSPRTAESPKASDDLVSTSERNKVINLPDISEIRRINQRLLTAEVTPIQVQNSTPQVPVSIVSPAKTDPSQKDMQIVETEKDIPNVATDSRGPPKLVDITQDNSPTSSKTNPALRTYSSTSSLNSRLFQENVNQPGRFIGRPPKMLNGKRVFPKPVSVPWKPRHAQPEIPWFSVNNDSINIKKMEETLLTLDTLNKMLYLLSDEQKDTPDPQKAQQKTTVVKKARKRYIPPNHKNQGVQTVFKYYSDDVQVVNETTEVTQERYRKEGYKPKINIRFATNYPSGQKEQSKVVEAETSDSNNSVDAKKKTSKQFCCWSRQRLVLMHTQRRVTQHDCPYPECNCCCKELLNDHFASVAANNKKMENIIHANRTEFNSRTLTNVADKSQSFQPGLEVVQTPAKKDQDALVGTIEGSVKSTVESAVQTSEDIPVVDVDETIVEEPIDLDASDMEGSPDVPTLGSEVSVTTTKVLLHGPPRGIDMPVSVSTTSTTKPPPDVNNRIILQPRATSTLLATPKLSLDLTTELAIVNQSLPTLKKSVRGKKVSTGIKRTLPSLKPFKPPKNFKERMIFLNSKQISDKPAENPIFLGKNKILLTTVKFPPNLKIFEEAKQQLGVALKLPKGVQLICLPNGSITYTTNPNVEVNSAGLTTVPAIVAAVQAYINAHPVTLSEPNPVGANEVVDLVDDDDVVNVNENSETPPVVNIQSINEDQATASENPTADCSNTEEEENRTADLNGTVTNVPTEVQIENSENIGPVENGENICQIENTEDISQLENNGRMQTENSENIITNQNIVTEIQEHAPELAHDEISTTTVDQSQPEASDLNASNDVQTSTSAPSIAKSKNILSDLMEMSGIFDEDITPTQEATLPVEPVIPQTLPVEQPVEAPLSPPSLVSTAQPSSLKPIVLPKPAFDNARTISAVPPVVKSPIGELSPITSLYELKYACLNNGIFFKLDFETGYLVPINVCMKQHSKQLMPTPKILTKSVIDLTDDDDAVNTSNTTFDQNVSIDTPNTSFDTANSSFEMSNVSVDSSNTSEDTSDATNTSSISRSLLISNNISTINTTDGLQPKPVKLFRTPNIIRPKKALSFQRIKPKTDGSEGEYVEKITNADQDLQQYESKRKQFLNKVFSYNLGKMDSSSIEQLPRKEYVNKRKRKRILATNTDIEQFLPQSIISQLHLPEQENAKDPADSDDSDDEPLSNLVKRKREEEIAPVIPNVEEIPVSASADVDTSEKEPVAQDAEMNYEDEVLNEPMAQNEALNCEEELLRETPLIQSIDEEAEEENCILGV